MKKRILCFVMAVTLTVSMLLLPGCGNSTSDEKGTEKAASQTEQTPKTEEPVEIKWLGVANAGMYPTEDSYIVQELNKRFNVRLKIIKVDYTKEQEMNLYFASGEIPDHFMINSSSLLRFLNEGLIRNIPLDMLKKTAPNLYKSTEENYPQVLEMPVYKDGNLLAIPEGTKEFLPFTVIRTDWLNKMGAKMPANLAEFEEVCRLFTAGDPDGDGKADTYAFNILAGSFTSIYHIGCAFGVPLPGGTIKDETWLKDSSGKLLRSQVSENYRNMLKYVANLYKKGYIHPDVTLKGNAESQLFSDEIIGIKTSGWTNVMPKYRPSDWLALTYKKNPNATTAYMPPLKGPNAEDAIYENQSSVWRYLCIGKNTSDAKLNKILQILDAQVSDMEVHNLIWRGKEGLHYTVDQEGMAVLTKDYSSNEKQIEVGMKYFLINNRNTQQQILSFGKEVDVQSNFQKNWKMVNQLLPPGTIISKQLEFGADVKKIEDEFFINTITGVWNTDSEWNNYIKRWNAAGGDQITKEVNEIYAKAKK